MSVWSWTGFVPCGGSAAASVGRSTPDVLLHFFPLAEGVTAPHPVEAVVDLFAAGRLLGRRSFDGLRLNQPDGVDLADVFPELFRSLRETASRSISKGATTKDPRVRELRETQNENVQRQQGVSPQWNLSHLTAVLNKNSEDGEHSAHENERKEMLPSGDFGISIQLGASQPRVDLSRSRIVIEIRYPSHTLRYHAVQAGQELGLKSKDVLLSDEISIFAQDGFETRVVEINADPVDEAVRQTSAQGEEGEAQSAEEFAQSSAGYSLASYEVSRGHLPNSGGRVSRFGFESAGRLPRAAPFESDSGFEAGDGISRFLVRYESASSLPISVRCL